MFGWSGIIKLTPQQERELARRKGEQQIEEDTTSPDWLTRPLSEVELAAWENKPINTSSVQTVLMGRVIKRFAYHIRQLQDQLKDVEADQQ